MNAITVRTPTKPMRERSQAGPEQGSTWHIVETETTVAHTRDANPPAHSGVRLRPSDASSQTAESIMAVPQKSMSKPVRIRAALSLAHSRTI